MAYDLKILNNRSGRIDFVLPDSPVEGASKLMQRVIITLFSDDGSLIKFAKGSANANGLTETMLTNETNRVKELLFNNTPAHYPDSERLSTLSLLSVENNKGSAQIEIALTSADMHTDNITINL